MVSNAAYEIQVASEELQKASVDVKKLPEMHSELAALKQEHQKLCSAFEYEKNWNLDQNEQMKATEKNLISLTRDLEKLQSELAKAGTSIPNPYADAYYSPDPVTPPVGQGRNYADQGYSQGIGYGNAGYGYAREYADVGYGQGTAAGYSGAYGRPPGQMITSAAADGMHSSRGANVADYQDGVSGSDDHWDSCWKGECCPMVQIALVTMVLLEEISWQIKGKS